MLYTSAFYSPPSGRLAPCGLGLALGSYLLASARRQNNKSETSAKLRGQKAKDKIPFGSKVLVVAPRVRRRENILKETKAKGELTAFAEENKRNEKGTRGQGLKVWFLVPYCAMRS
jgi:hypothetical protein